MTATSASGGNGILRKLRRFKNHQGGIAAMEFALVAPIMIGMYFMLNETASGLRASRKVSMVTRVMADIATRPNTLTDADRNDIFASAVPVMQPFSASNGAYRLTSIRFDATGKGFVDWSDVTGSGLGGPIARCTPTESRPTRPDLTPISIPSGLKVPNTSVIMAEALVRYRPVIGWNITGDVNLQDKLFMSPRTAAFVTRNGVTNPDCTY
jgi:Flp pilus assembly protein TadG